MLCPNCRAKRLAERNGKNGLVVDYCRACKGIWLDGGELYLLSNMPRELEAKLRGGLRQPRPSERLCPRCKSALQSGGLLHPELEVEQCPECEGLWFDEGEIKQAIHLDRQTFDLPLDDVEAPSASEPLRRNEKPHERLRSITAGSLPLPNLIVRSASVLVLLYSLLGLILITLVEIGKIEASWAVPLFCVIVVAQYVLGPWLMDLSLSWCYQLTWKTVDELPPHLGEFVVRVCDEQTMTPPSFGLIHDSAPNAFTYGHHPGNMRIVISEGILELLEPAEFEAVVAHEIGHGKHWDMALMTVAQLVPMLLYYVYRTLIHYRGGKDDKSAPYRFAIAVGAYVLYVVSEYVVLWFSRCREYHADRFAGRVTNNPNALAAALVKIAYGLAAGGKRERTKDAAERNDLEAIGALGIFNAGAARSLVITAATPAGTERGVTLDVENIKSAMQWDLWNPWASYYELHSTHPLVAKRLQYLAEQAASLEQQPYVVFDRRQPESFWDEFFVDLAILTLPFALAMIGALTAFAVLGGQIDQHGLMGILGAAAVGGGSGSLIKLRFRYRSDYFAPMSVAGLLHKVKVSAVRPIPARVTGTVLGRGVPGLLWSEDVVMQDKTGILFLDYRQPLRIWELFFGLFRTGDFAGKQVSATGWFRRSPVPYLEVHSFTIDGQERTCYARLAAIAFAGLLVVAGVVMIAVAVGAAP